MSTHRTISTVAATAVAAVMLAAGLAAPASAAPSMPNTFTAYETGYGPTLADAESNAEGQFGSDYYGCSHTYTLVSSSQLADGSWQARMETTCSGWV